MCNYVTSIWKNALIKSPKLSFLNNTKPKWSSEIYINKLPFSFRKTMTRIRISAHRLSIEVDRYNKPPLERSKRFCEFCNMNGSPGIIGDEEHLLFHCLPAKTTNFLQTLRHYSSPATQVNSLT